MFTFPGKSQIFWTVIIALVVMAAVSRIPIARKLVTGESAAA